jgi:quercetin dioxygenase-like cupin family protein
MVIHESERKARPVYGEGLRSVSKQILVGPREGFAGFLREFTVEPGGFTPYHQHDWHHVVYILEGQGTLRTAEGEQSLERGSVIYAAPGSLHGFANAGSGVLRFLCLVPEKGDAYSPAD